MGLLAGVKPACGGVRLLLPLERSRHLTIHHMN
jgi:hypothetical protein